MHGFGGGMPIDIENDPDDLLVMRLSNLYRSCATSSRIPGKQRVSEQWFECNIHKDLVSICNKFSDKRWFDKGQNWYCIYYACAILNEMAKFSKTGATRVANEPNFISTLLLLWQGNHLSWIESRCAVKTIQSILAFAPQLWSRFLNNDAGVNLVKLAIVQYGQCLFDTIKNCAIVPNKIEPGYIVDLMGIIKGKSMDYDTKILRDHAIELAQEWMSLNGTILGLLGLEAMYSHKGDDKFQPAATSEHILRLFAEVDILLIEKACAMDLCWSMDYTNPDVFVKNVEQTFMGCMVFLSHFEDFCRKLSESDNIVEWLIVHLRSIKAVSDRYDLIIHNLLKLDLINKKYYPDLAATLLALLNCDKKMRRLPVLSYHANCLSLFDSVSSSLKLIFNIALDVELVGVHSVKKYQCKACKKLLRHPHKLKNCRHNYCFWCILTKLSVNVSNTVGMRKCIVKNCDSEEFNMLEWSKFNYSLWNEINSFQTKTLFPDGSDFVGTPLEFWQKVKENSSSVNKNILTPDQFDYYVHFMIKEVSIQQVSDLKLMKQKALDKKAEGNGFFKQQLFESAIECYKEALRLCPNQYGADRMTYFSNLALAYMNVGNYARAYWSCLSGLAFNRSHLKLGNSLIKCYENVPFDQIFLHIGDQEPKMSYFEDSPMITLEKRNMVHQAYMCAKKHFFQHFSAEYMTAKCEIKNSKNLTPKEESKLMSMWENLQRTDVVANLVSVRISDILNKIFFIKVHHSQFLVTYGQFRRSYENCKRSIYRLMFDTLADKKNNLIGEVDKADKSVEVKSGEMYRLVKSTFTMNQSLVSIASDPEKQNCLVYGFYYNSIGDRKTGQLLPDEMVSMIVKHIFSETSFDFEDMQHWTISEVTRAYRSKLTSGSTGRRDCIVFKKNADPSRNNWKEIEFDSDDDDDSCAEQFLNRVQQK